MLARPDEEHRLCGEVNANNDAGRPEKTLPCWRASTEDKGFAGRSTPTMTPAGRENPDHVGVPRRRTKALRRVRRQHVHLHH